METIKFIIEGVAPLSANKMNSFNKYGGNKNHGIKSNTINEIKDQLLKKTSEIFEFKRNFNPKNEVLTAYYKFYFPMNIFFTKKGELSSRRVDIDNCIKLIQDSITRTMGIDDKYIVDLIIEVRPASDFRWEISYSKLQGDSLL